jgi:predicted Zn finger-like uncharacterized protein
MASMKIVCPHCDKSLKVAESAEGKKVRCPNCEKPFLARFEDEEPADEKRPVKKSQTRSNDEDGSDDDRPRKKTTRADEDDSDDDRPRKKKGDKKKAGMSPVLMGLLGCLAVVALVAAGVFGYPALTRGPEIAKGPLPQFMPPPGPFPPGNQPPPFNGGEENPPIRKDPQVLPARFNIELPPAHLRPLLVTDPGGHTATVQRALITPDKKQVVTVSKDKTVRIWDIASGETVRTLRLPMGLGTEGALLAAALTSDGKRLAVGGIPFGMGKHGFPVHLISLESGEIEKSLRGHTETIVDLAFTRDGKYLVSGSADKTAILFDVAAGKVVTVMKGHKDTVRSVVLSPDDQRLATLSPDNTVRLWKLPDGTPDGVLDKFPEQVFSVAWNPVRPEIATGGNDGTLHLWTPQGKPIKIFKIDPKDRIQSFNLFYTADGKELIYTGVSFSGRAGVINTADGKLRYAFTKHDNTIQCASVSHDRQWVVSSGGDNHNTLLWNVADGEVLQEFVGRGRSVWGVGWRLDGKVFAWGNSNGGNTHLGQTRLERAFEWPELDFAPLPDANNTGRVASRLGPYELRVVDFFKIAILKNGQPHQVFQSKAVGDRLYSMSTIPGNRAVIGGSYGMYLVDLESGRELRRYRGHNGMVIGVSPSPDGRSFLTGGIDQTLCLWDPDREDPLVSLFSVGNDWIAWTPEGFYACSPQGERLIGWLTNNGPDRMASYHPASRFRRSLYRSEVIRLLFQERSLGKALEMAAAQRPENVPNVHVGQVLPPTVAITTPGAAVGNVAKLATYQVKAKAASNGDHPVTTLRLLVNGRPHQGEQGARIIDNPKVGEVEVAWDVDLLPGKHVLHVMAESSVSRAVSDPVEVLREGGKEEELPNLYLLAAGISEYEGEMRLNYAHADAIAIEKALRQSSKGVFNKVETKLLTDAQATRGGIVAGMGWLKQSMGPRDVAIIFLAGHGSRDPRGEFHFIPVDVDLRNVTASCVSGEFIKRAVGNLPGRVVVMLDACHSGAASTPGRTAVSDDLVRDLVGEDYGVVVMCSSQGREYSMESAAVKHGFFTISILEGLSGKADFNRDSYVYIHEVSNYANLRVRQMSQGQQNPVTGRPPNIRPFPLGKLAASAGD